MNLPNKLTVARIILTPIFLLALIVEFPFHYGVSLLIFIVASITDLLDGKIARKRGLVTDFGKFLDPLADKMLTTAAFIGLMHKGIGAGIEWILFIVLFREFAVSSIRLIASSSGGKVIAANIWGKLKTVFQMIAVIFALAAEEFLHVLGLFAVPENLLATLDSVVGIASTVLLWVSAVLCIISGVIYVADNKDFIKEAK